MNKLAIHKSQPIVFVDALSLWRRECHFELVRRVNLEICWNGASERNCWLVTHHPLRSLLAPQAEKQTKHGLPVSARKSMELPEGSGRDFWFGRRAN